ncbi:hypothetical protein I308_106668 [Cryptococcus tetragattii IND107]|uniref:Uncharacterized protein n=1 Tax=Cryptococcus tetragattii IND107 TaxID=1296105 RepID=A0ABR3BJJ1_9TREE
MATTALTEHCHGKILKIGTRDGRTLLYERESKDGMERSMRREDSVEPCVELWISRKGIKEVMKTCHFPSSKL